MGKSSKDKRDAYYRLAKEQGWRARSAFKLLQLDEHFDLFDGVTRVVDLCAAPGSWSQVLSRVLIKRERLGRAAWEDKRYKTLLKLDQSDLLPKNETTSDELTHPPENVSSNTTREVKIVAIDLQPMSPLEGITCLKADITHPSTIPLLLRALDPQPKATLSSAAEASHPVDLVLSDGAPDVTGLHDLDIYIQAQLLWAALNLALCVLKPGGKFVAKIFRAKDVDLICAQMRVLFKRVTIAKPRSSRASSLEAFIVCEDFRPPAGFKASLEHPLGTTPLQPVDMIHDKVSALQVTEGDIPELEFEDLTVEESTQNRWIAPFLACGDLSAYDADASHKLPEGYVTLDPVQPPTAPPYRQALEERKRIGGAYGKTKLSAVS